MINVAVLGCGAISYAHIPSWLKVEGAKLVAICDIREEATKGHINENSDFHIYTDYENMISNEKIDILDICLPTYLHPKYSIDAMDRGINVLCEKPIALNLDDAKSMYEASRRNNVKFMVAQVLRFWGEYTYIKQLIDSKEYGKLLCANMYRTGEHPAYSWNNWMLNEELSGLVAFDLHIHDLDFIVNAVGTPKNITTSRVQNDTQDILCRTYNYDDFFVTMETAWYKHRIPFKSSCKFFFENASAIYDGTLKIYTDSGEVIEPNFNAELESGKVLGLPSSDGYFNEIQYFYNCVKYDKPIDHVTEESITDVLKILKSN